MIIQMIIMAESIKSKTLLARIVFTYNVECSTDEFKVVRISVLLEYLPVVAQGGADDCLLNQISLQLM